MKSDNMVRLSKGMVVCLIVTIVGLLSQAVNLWAAEARCTHEVTEKFPILHNEVILHRYAGGKPAWEGGPDTEVWFYEVINGDHSWAEKDMNTCQEIWRFFKKYVR